MDSIFQSDLEDNISAVSDIVSTLDVFADTLENIHLSSPETCALKLLPVLRAHYRRFEQRCLAEGLFSDEDLTGDLFPFLAMFNELLFKAKSTKHIHQVPAICRGITHMINDHYHTIFRNQSPVIKIDYN